MPTQPTPWNQRRGMPGYGGGYPQGPWPPLPPIPTYPYPASGGAQPQPELPSAQGQASVAAQPQPQPTLAQKFMDPRLGALLSAVGASMSQPLRMGQTGWGKAGEAMSSGYNTLATMRALQDQRARQHWEDQLKVNAEVRAQKESESRIKGQEIQGKVAEGTLQLNQEQLRLQREMNRAREMMELVKTEQERQQWKATFEQRKSEFADTLTQRKAEAADQRTFQQGQTRIGEKNAEANMMEARARAAQANANIKAIFAETDMTRAKIKELKDGNDPKSETAKFGIAKAIPTQMAAISRALSDPLMDEDAESRKVLLQEMRDLVEISDTLNKDLGLKKSKAAAAGTGAATPATGQPKRIITKAQADAIRNAWTGDKATLESTMKDRYVIQ